MQDEPQPPQDVDTATGPYHYDQWHGPAAIPLGAGATARVMGVLAYECVVCLDSGYVRLNNSPGEKGFGQAHECRACNIVERRRQAKAHG